MTEDVRPLVLSVFATFAVGGSQVRFAALANHFGRSWRHAIIAMDGRYDCAARLSPEVEATFPQVAIRRGGFAYNLAEFRRALRRLAPDVLVTHNWGSIEWGLANNLGPRRRHVHVEDGFGPEEAHGQLGRRVLARRLLLRGSTVVLPSLTLLKIAEETWRLPSQALRHVPNGLDLDRFQPRPEAAPTGRTPSIGAVGALRPEKNFARLLCAAKRLIGQGLVFELTLVGDGPERGRLEALTAELGLGGVVTFQGLVRDPASAYRGFDVFALSSDTEQMPLSVLESMAAGLPVAATAVGDLPEMLAPENRPFLCDRDEAPLADALGRLLVDADLRVRVGRANRLKAAHDYDQRAMFRRYAELLLPRPQEHPAEVPRSMSATAV